MGACLQFFRNLPIQRKISFGILLTCATALAVAAGAIFVAQLRTFRQSFTRDLEVVAQMLAHNTTAALTFNDARTAQDLLSAIRAKPYILRAALDLADGSQFASFQSGTLRQVPAIDQGDGFHSAGGFLALNRPIILAGERIATLRLLSDYRTEYRRSLEMYLTILAGALLVSILLALVLSARLERLIATPILDLAGTAHNVAEQKNYSLRAQKLSQDEVGQLTDAFNQMLTKIAEDDQALRRVNQSLEHEIDERKRRERQIESLHKELMQASRHAGMAEVASAVLHNVGNVLNSVNVSANLINEVLEQSPISGLGKLAGLLEAHRTDLSNFLVNDPKGQRVPLFVSTLAAAEQEQRQQLTGEIRTLLNNIEHIKEIVAMQQNYATLAGVTEDLPISDLVEAAVRMNTSALQRHGIVIERQFEPVPLVRVDKHKVLQILINVLRNANHALEHGRADQKILTLRVHLEAGRVQVSVSDNGVGIAAENLTRIFGHGFTTKRDGHGFGLHSGALAAKEMGGSLRACSDGQGKGATFILDLPPAPSNEIQHA